MKYVLLRKTSVRDGVKGLPRPKLTQQVLRIGEREELLNELDLIYDDPANQSSDEVEVELVVVKWDGQKTSTSARPNNGKRNPRSKGVS